MGNPSIIDIEDLYQRTTTYYLVRVTTRIHNNIQQIVTYPFLSVGVGQVVDGLRVPLLPDTEQVCRQESVLSHNDEVHEEAGRGLDHTDLPVGHRDQPANTRTCQNMVKQDGAKQAQENASML